MELQVEHIGTKRNISTGIPCVLCAMYLSRKLAPFCAPDMILLNTQCDDASLVLNSNFRCAGSLSLDPPNSMFAW